MPMVLPSTKSYPRVTDNPLTPTNIVATVASTKPRIVSVNTGLPTFVKTISAVTGDPTEAKTQSPENQDDPTPPKLPSPTVQEKHHEFHYCSYCHCHSWKTIRREAEKGEQKEEEKNGRSPTHHPSQSYQRHRLQSSKRKEEHKSRDRCSPKGDTQPWKTLVRNDQHPGYNLMPEEGKAKINYEDIEVEKFTEPPDPYSRMVLVTIKKEKTSFRT